MSNTIRWRPDLEPFDKDPDDVIDYPWDFADWLGDEVIVDAEALAENMTAEIENSADKTVNLRVSGGEDGGKGQATVRITTSTGQQIDRSIRFRFRHL